MWNLVSQVKGKTEIKGVWKQSALEGIWTLERWRDRRTDDSTKNYLEDQIKKEEMDEAFDRLMWEMRNAGWDLKLKNHN